MRELPEGVRKAIDMCVASIRGRADWKDYERAKRRIDAACGGESRWYDLAIADFCRRTGL